MDRPMRIDFAQNKRRQSGGGGGYKSPGGKAGNKGAAIVSRPLSERTPGSTKIFIGNLSWSIEDQNIYDLFKDAGEVCFVHADLFHFDLSLFYFSSLLVFSSTFLIAFAVSSTT